MLKKLPYLFLFLLSFIGQAQDIPLRPTPSRLVNDMVGMLSTSELESLERKLVSFNDSSSTQITVVIVKTTQPYDIADYAMRLGRAWGVGQKDKNNGVVLLWAPSDRRITIQTGYGMEGVLPDAYAKRIIETIIKPNFKQLRYYDGLNQGTDQIISYTKGEYKNENTSQGEEFPFELFLFALLLMFIFLYFMRNSGGGGNDGGYLPNQRKRYGRGDGWTTYGSGGWYGGGGGGSDWGSSGGGGGFGGFGGGSFGGGGASGDY